jgi:uncharacterized alkaline shock family protein YloU
VILRIFNKIVVLVLLAGLAYLGLLGVLHALNARLGDQTFAMQDLARNLNLEGIVGSVTGFLDRVQNGDLTSTDIAVLALIALLGLILLLLELFSRPAPRFVTMQRGTYTTRGLVETEVENAAGRVPEVLQADADVTVQRRPGARVDLRTSVRRGENTRAIEGRLREQVQQHLAQAGIPVSRLNVRVNETDPREARTRVK